MKKINDNSMPFLGNNTTNHNVDNKSIRSNKDNSIPYLGNDVPTSQNLEGKVIMKKTKGHSMPFLGNNTTNHNLDDKAIRNIKDNTMPYLGNDAPTGQGSSGGSLKWRDKISSSDTLSRINSSQRLGGRR
tara:strand:- start:78 stop:467 length:390 start_codon:yes stop_codon:yes gene_type:complete